MPKQGQVPGLFDGTPRADRSLDLQTLDDALPVADIAVRAGVDWLEVGTPLILGEGLHRCERFANATLIIPSLRISRRWTPDFSKVK